jgi:hypothetical protein
VPQFHRILRSFASAAFTLSAAALAATPITGVVTNKTSNKPSAGDTVTLIRLAQGMTDSTVTKTDSRGRFTLEVPDDGLHLVRVTHDKATYFRPAPPGTQSVDIDVYDAAPKVEGVTTSVEEIHVEATSTELHIVEILQVVNKSTPLRTQYGPEGYDFYLPAGAMIQRTAALTDNGMPVQTPAVPVGDPDHYKLLFPIRPGETQFGIFYNLPYTGTYTFSPKLATPVTTFAILVPHGIKFKTSASSPFVLEPASAPGAETWSANNVSPSQPLAFTVSGTGELPRDAPKGQETGSSAQSGAPASGAPVAATDNTMPGKGLDNPLDPNGNRDPWGQYKGWILAGLAIVLAIGGGILLRKPTGPATASPAASAAATPPATQESQLLHTLKEELFALETDRLQNRISDADYDTHKAALETLLRRALNRTSTATEAGPQ